MIYDVLLSLRVQKCKKYYTNSSLKEGLYAHCVIYITDICKS
jgi:hypothetical protein